MATPATANLTSLDPVIKTLYPQKTITKFFYENAPLLALMPKKTNFGGKNAQVAMRIATTTGGGADFATAMANRGAATYSKLLLTRSRDYSIFTIDAETIDATMGDPNAIVEGLQNEIDAAMDQLRRAMQIDVYRNGGGVRGKGDGAYSVAGATIQLATPQDIVNFEVNQWLVFASTDGTTGAPRSGHVQVASIDRDLGKITCTGNVTAGIAAAVNTDYIFREGDFLNGSTTMKVVGLDGWLPLAAPTSTAFFGLDRSIEPYRLGGVRFANAVASGQIEETIQKLCARIAREGGKPDAAVLNSDDWLTLALSMESRFSSGASITETQTDVGLGFTAIKIVTPTGTVKVYSDPNCPAGRVYVLQMDTWQFWTLGEAPRFLGQGKDNLRLLREANADSYTGRIGYYGQIWCSAPGYNGVALV